MLSISIVSPYFDGFPLPVFAVSSSSNFGAAKSKYVNTGVDAFVVLLCVVCRSFWEANVMLLLPGWERVHADQVCCC